MPKLLQIDSCRGVLSTGRISEGIAKSAMRHGWDCYIAHGARYMGETIQHSYQIETKFGEYCHFAKSLFFDAHGLGSGLSTRKFIRWIDELKPDIIQLHCIHGYYLNYKLLFEYLNETSIPVVWTFHDCWAFTGHCAHFVNHDCSRWKSGCFDCPVAGDYPESFSDRSARNFQVKKQLFLGNRSLHLVAVSNWLADYVKDSFFAGVGCDVIHNGVDLNVFKPRHKNADDGFLILGVSGTWNKSKGLHDFYRIREYLPVDRYRIILVGLTEEQIIDLPEGIVGIRRTDSLDELAELYSSSDVFVNPTYADSLPTVNMEALACGTPVVTYRTGGSPEIIDENTGVVVGQGDVNSLCSAVISVCMKGRSHYSAACRKRAETCFDRDAQFEKYLNLYESLIHD